MKLNVIDWIALVLVIIGALNWGLVGIINLNIVEAIFGTGIITTIVYVLVGLAGLWAIYLAIKIAK